MIPVHFDAPELPYISSPEERCKAPVSNILAYIRVLWRFYGNTVPYWICTYFRVNTCDVIARACREKEMGREGEEKR